MDHNDPTSWPRTGTSGPGFSARTSWDRGESLLSRAIREARTAGRPLLDLTLANPTTCGFDFDRERILGALSNPAAMLYNPDPKGLSSAREAVAAYYSRHAATIDPAHLILTTSTSEAYSFLFRLLCDPGDEVLVAQPGYPLFDFLADLEDVRLRSYPLFHDFGWWIDFAELERRISPRTRAILLVHPNNPTGHATSRAERDRLETICVRHNLALIVDEVFLDYSLGDPIESFATGQHPALTFVVSGLSKIAALPQMKVGWLACFGPVAVRTEALGRLEVIADTFLSMNAPAQYALPTWLDGSSAMVEQILTRVRANLSAIPAGTLDVLPVAAGWSAVLRLPFAIEEELQALVREAGVIVHPGSFYGFAAKNRAVVSLIGSEEAFAQGIQKLEFCCESRISTYGTAASTVL